MARQIKYWAIDDRMAARRLNCWDRQNEKVARQIKSWALYNYNYIIIIIAIAKIIIVIIFVSTIMLFATNVVSALSLIIIREKAGG